MKMCYCAGLVVSGMLMGMGALYMIEKKQSKSIEQMISDAKNSIDEMMN